MLVALAYPLARYVTHVVEGRARWGGRIEHVIWRLCGVKADAEMGWLQYTFALLLFNGVGLLAVYALQRFQLFLPLNPEGFGERVAGLLVQHGGQLRREHELAGLCRASRR